LLGQVLLCHDGSKRQRLRSRGSAGGVEWTAPNPAPTDPRQEVLSRRWCCAEAGRLCCGVLGMHTHAVLLRAGGQTSGGALPPRGGQRISCHHSRSSRGALPAGDAQGSPAVMCPWGCQASDDISSKFNSIITAASRKRSSSRPELISFLTLQLGWDIVLVSPYF